MVAVAGATLGPLQDPQLSPYHVSVVVSIASMLSSPESTPLRAWAITWPPGISLARLCTAVLAPALNHERILPRGGPAPL